MTVRVVQDALEQTYAGDQSTEAGAVLDRLDDAGHMVVPTALFQCAARLAAGWAPRRDRGGPWFRWVRGGKTRPEPMTPEEADVMEDVMRVVRAPVTIPAHKNGRAC